MYVEIAGFTNIVDMFIERQAAIKCDTETFDVFSESDRGASDSNG